MSILDSDQQGTGRENTPKRPTGILALVVVMVGQVISLLGSGMTGFAMPLWIWGKEPDKAAPLTLAWFAFVVTVVLFSPVAGALVDRWNRKLVMMLSDLAAGLTTVAILVLYSTGYLEIWHIYVTNAISGAFQAFQFPAFSAAVTAMVPKKHYGRVSGMMSLSHSLSGIFAPMLAVALLGIVGFGGILVIDVITFVVAIGALLLVHVPQAERTAAGEEGQGNLLQESLYGFRYIFQRPSLLGLQLVFMFGNLLTTLSFPVSTPMILTRTGGNETILAIANAAGAGGGIAGGLLMSAWGGPKRKSYGVVFGWVLSGLLGMTLLGLGRGLTVWAIASFAGSFMIPIINGSNQAIWQAKVAPDVQGRVFSIRAMIAWITTPLGALGSGFLADHLFEPAVRETGALSAAFGGLVGTEPGSGMSLMFVLFGALAAAVGLCGYASPVVRNAEDILPDHEPAVAEAQAPSGAIERWEEATVHE